MTATNESLVPPSGPPFAPRPGGADVAQALRFSYEGTGGDLFLLALKNVFLTLVTLGVYGPWARTAKREFLWRHTDVGGHRLEYTGTGRELLIGYLKVIVGYMVLLGIPNLVARWAPLLGGVMKAAGVLVIFLLLPYAIYWSRRYLLSRTRWRGIRFGLGGNDRDFAKAFYKGALLTALTLGFYGPVMNNRLHGILVRNTHYGSMPFAYEGADRQAFRIGIKGFFLSLLTLGIYYFWYAAELQRFRVASTRFDGATGALDASGGLFFKLTMVNLFGNALTLGLAFPWTATYTLRQILSRLSLVGAIDYAQIVQQPSVGNAAGDALGGALGVELGV
ncbi:MAG TPA: DUF898 family protein [Polyangia bacterium]|nr:DUF898 family protein [Polyangia bacterium]